MQKADTFHDEERKSDREEATTHVQVICGATCSGTVGSAECYGSLLCYDPSR